MYLSTRNPHSLSPRPHSLYDNISRTSARMKIEELIFAMSDDNNDFLEDATNSSSSKCGSHESDEGCCIIPTAAVQDPQSMRRVKSTPNLLQIPSPLRSRKRSDDSAVGSAEESDLSDKSSSDNFTVTEPVERFMLNNAKSPQEDPPMTLTVEGRLLRPPSVVVSDHDLCQEGYQTFITLDDLDAEFSQQQQRRRLSDCSTCSSLSFSESDFAIHTFQQEEEPEDLDPNSKKTSRWRTLRTIVHQLTPFIQTYKKQRYPWVQLAGHQGNFKPGGQPGTILKKFCAKEKEAFELLMNDELKPYVPQYHGIAKEEVVEIGGAEFIQLEDLLGQFTNPCVMDCKLGVRTYLEEELLKAKEKPKLRKDMYEKMCQIDRAAPTMEEHQLRGVTKPRYMVWRETISTTATFGFRIEGVRRSDGTSSKDYKTTKSEEQVKDAFNSFVDGFTHVIQQYLDRLYALKSALSKSQFFATHEVIGSSLLFVHDESKASLWMIDFAKTCPLPEGIPPISHDKPWSVGNHEDGYLIGLSNLIKIFEDMLKPEQQE